MNKKIKIFAVLISICMIYGGFIFSVLQKDNQISYIENKILTKFPRFNIQSIISGSFMNKFDTYTTDQFPGRVGFIKLKNSVDYLIGKREFRNIYISKNKRLLEHFKLNEETLFDNIDGINNLSKSLKIKASLLLIPTSIELYKNELPSYAITDSQENVFNIIRNRVTINFFSALETLAKNKDKDIFFKTDHHWTQLGAKLVFEDIFKKEISETPSTVTNDFYGSYYSKALLRFIKPDKIEVYNSSGDYKIHIDYERELNSLYDKSKLNSKNKYQYFLSGDPGRALIEGRGEGSILILKDSFAHNFIPFLCSEFKDIHIIDSRYYNVNIKDYIEKHNIQEIFFIHNISTLNSEKIY